MALHKIAKFTESKTLELRFETFNAFNLAQFLGGSVVDGKYQQRDVRLCDARGASTHLAGRREIHVLTCY